MASDEGFVKYVCDQMSGAGPTTCRKMFGEYAVYCDGKVVALVCDNRLYVKPTCGGRSWAGDVVEAPPYEGAKSHFLIEEKIDDWEWLSNLIRVTAGELPVPVRRSKKSGKA